MHNARVGATLCAVMVALLVVISAPWNAMAGGCTKDTDCKGERVCTEGKCVASGAPAAKACASDTDCMGGEYCDGGTCRSVRDQPAPPSDQPPPAASW